MLIQSHAGHIEVLITAALNYGECLVSKLGLNLLLIIKLHIKHDRKQFNG